MRAGRELRALLDRLEPEIRREFMRAIREQKGKINKPALIRALKSGNVAKAMEAVNLQTGGLRWLNGSIFGGYSSAGEITMATLGAIPHMRKQIAVEFEFETGNPRAELWAREHSTDHIYDDARHIIREIIEDGIRVGDNPNKTALRIVGRVDRATGRRIGGVIGLNKAQGRAVRTAQLELSDPATMKAYLRRGRRDKRFDSMVHKAIREDRQLSPSEVSKIMARYEDRLLLLRGQTIARTESMAAANGGQYEAMLQLVQDGAVEPDQIKRIWRTAVDSRVRDSHRSMEGQVTTFDLPFSNGLLYPGDPRAKAEDAVNCRCIVELDIDFTAARRRLRNG